MKMKVFHTLSVIVLIPLLLSACKSDPVTPRAKHVILIGLDGMGSYGFQRAATPYMNNIAKKGALSVKARSVLPSDSSPNWASMLTGAIPNQHGITSNDWQPDNHNIEPSLKNKIGLFPSIFDDIKSQRPDYKVYAFTEWKGLGRMFDSSVPEKVVNSRDGAELLNAAIGSFFSDKPEFLFVAINETDHVGHEYGHESKEYFDCITKYDSLIGKLAARLEEEKMADNTVLIITADHGGIGINHGGDTPNEMEIPVILYGGNVTKGKIITEVNIVSDIATTVAGLLGVTMPRECAGRFIYSAFEPKTDIEYAPVPLIAPQSGLYNSPVEVRLRADSPDANIFFTLDNSEPGTDSPVYEKPFVLDSTATIKAVTMVGNTSSRREQAFIRITDKTSKPLVHYKYYENYNLLQVPDSKTLSNPDQEGYVYEFSLAELKLKNKDHFAVQFSSAIQIDDPGEYSFSVCSDDGSKLYIDDKLVVDNDGSHSRIIKTGKLSLDNGTHGIRIDYFDDYGSEFLEVTYESGTVPKQIIPFKRLL